MPVIVVARRHPHDGLFIFSGSALVTFLNFYRSINPPPRQASSRCKARISALTTTA